MCRCNIGALSPLVAAAQEPALENDGPVRTPRKIDPVTGTDVDTQFAHAAADRTHVTGIAQRHSADSQIDPRNRL